MDIQEALEKQAQDLAEIKEKLTFKMPRWFVLAADIGLPLLLAVVAFFLGRNFTSCP